MGGATLITSPSHWRCTGLSPRGRGNRWVGAWRAFPSRSIPAWAGQPPANGRLWVPSRVYPRVGGATAQAPFPPTGYEGLSPRGRGNRRRRRRRRRRDSVYPRVGGATYCPPLVLAPASGLSPRGRGNRVLAGDAAVLARSIPAWAGQPYFGNSVTARASLGMITGI